MKNAIATIIALVMLGLPVCSHSEMTSASFTIYADSVNTGGILSTGGSYVLEDTIGESPAGFDTGGVYEVRGGYQAMIRGSISLSLSSSSLNLGTLSPAVVSSASTTVTVSAETEAGYTLSVESVAGTSVTPVTDGTVSAGSQEYGVSASGSDAVLVGDNAIANGLVISSTSSVSVSSDTVLDFKASISPSTPGGSYSQNISLIAAVNL